MNVLYEMLQNISLKSLQKHAYIAINYISVHIYIVRIIGYKNKSIWHKRCICFYDTVSYDAIAQQP